MSKNLKETREFIIGSCKLGAALKTLFSDGIQASDFAELAQKIASDEDLKKALLDAYNDAGQIPQEIKEASLLEDASLLPEIVNGIKEIIEAPKK
jgi:hypothetical protein